MRAEFLLDPDTVFLNHGSFGACPAEVFAAYLDRLREVERNPVEFLGRRSAALLLHSRERLASHLGAAASDLVYITNATAGVNIVARSHALRPGDEVLATGHEYGACDATWRVTCARAGACYKRVDVALPYDADRFVGTLLAAASPRTRLIFASHVASPTGLIFPVAALCDAARESGIPTFIDGAHAPGQIALDLESVGADYYTGNCHKWLCAPKGAAFLHVRPERQAAIDATVVSWGYLAAELSGNGPTDYDAYTGTGVLERRLQWQGTRDIAAFLAVPAAIDFQRRNAWPERRERCHAMAVASMHRVLARNGLQPIAPDSAFAQMVAIPVRTDDPKGLRRWLYERHRIEVAVTQVGGDSFVRVSVQAYNTEADLGTLEAGLAQARV
jgi:isopenicillin-N epimerase